MLLNPHARLSKCALICAVLTWCQWGGTHAQNTYAEGYVSQPKGGGACNKHYNCGIATDNNRCSDFNQCQCTGDLKGAYCEFSLNENEWKTIRFAALPFGGGYCGTDSSKCNSLLQGTCEGSFCKCTTAAVRGAFCQTDQRGPVTRPSPTPTPPKTDEDGGGECNAFNPWACSEHGDCSVVTATCSCHFGWTGEFCDKRSKEFYILIAVVCSVAVIVGIVVAVLVVRGKAKAKKRRANYINHHYAGRPGQATAATAAQGYYDQVCGQFGNWVPTGGAAPPAYGKATPVAVVAVPTAGYPQQQQQWNQPAGWQQNHGYASNW